MKGRVPVVLGVAAFALYAWCAAPGPYWLDSQELAAAGVRLGSPHPTGFPLFCLLARLAALVPFGELAYRVHLVSAACAAVSVGLCARVTMELIGDDVTAVVAGAGAGAVLALSATFFRQATVTEVYAPTAAMLALAMWLGLRVLRGGDRRAGLALFLVAGVGATGVHASFRLLMFAPLVLLWMWRLRRGARWALAAPTVFALGAVGMLVYLPLRSASGHVGLLDWGHPSTVGAMWDHAFAAARIRAAYASEMLSPVREVVSQHARQFGGLVEGDFGAVALTCAAVGLVALVWRTRPRAAGVAVVFVAAADAVYAVWVNPMGLGERQNGVPCAVGLAIAVGVGAAWLARRFGRAAPFAAGVVVVIAALPAGLGGAAAAGAVAASDAPRAWSEAALDECPPRGIALVMADDTAAGTLWLGAVEGARPDVAVLARQHLWDTRRAREVLARVGVETGATRVEEVVMAMLSSERPIMWEPGTDAVPRAYALGLGTPLASLHARSTDQDPAPQAAAAEAVLGRVFAGGADGDENGRALHGIALGTLGRGALAVGQPAAAERFFLAALAVDGRNVAAHINLGVLAAERGDFAGAAAATEAALAIDPNRPAALVNAARYRLAMGDDAAARKHVERAVRVAPGRADAHALYGILAARAKDWKLARREIERALAIDPANDDARTTMQLLKQRE